MLSEHSHKANVLRIFAEYSTIVFRRMFGEYPRIKAYEYSQYNVS